MVTEIKLRKEEYNLRLWILTLLGCSLQIILLASYIGRLMQNLRVGIATLQLDDPTALVAFFAIPMVYSMGASAMFTPKRIVSLLNIQLLTYIFATLMFSYDIMSYQTPTAYLQTLTVILMLLLVSAVVVGRVQTEIVRWVVGLNGTKEDVDQKTFAINANLRAISSIILKSSVRNLASLRIKERSQDYLLLQSIGSRRDNVAVVLALANDPENPSNSILSVVSYEKRYYSITKTERASILGDSIVLTLEKQLRKIDPTSRITPSEPNDIISASALHLALKPTESLVAGVKNIPRYQIMILFSIGLLFAAITYLFWTGSILQSEYIGALVVIVVAVLVEVAPVVRESIASKRQRYGLG